MASVTADTALGVATPPTKKRNYARILELTWIWSIVGYSILRFAIAWGAFADHGANVWVFGLIDVGTAWPYAKAVAAVCKRAAASEWRRLPGWLGIAIATFFAPYAYLWFSAGEMPAGVRVGMVICVSVLLLAASAGVLAKTRKLRRARTDDTAAAETVVDVRAVVDPQPLIDLTADEAITATQLSA